MDNPTPPAEPRTAAAIAFMEKVQAATLDPAIAKMIGAQGEVVLALVSPDAISDALAEAEAAVPAAPCSNCKHPYNEHTGRSIRPANMERLPDSRLGPIEAKPGHACEHLEDFHHTCGCPRWFEAAAPAAPELDVDVLAAAIVNVTRRGVVWYSDLPRMDAITLRDEYARLLRGQRDDG